MKRRPRAKRDPIDVGFSHLEAAVASIDAPMGPHSGGWGGIEHVYRSRPQPVRDDMEFRLRRITATLERWTATIARLKSAGEGQP